MNKSLAVFLILFPVAGAISAQNAPLTGISESTDPAKVAEVERRAQEIIQSQQAGTSGASGTSGTGASSDMMPGKSREGRTHDRMRDRMHGSQKGGKGTSSSSSDGGGTGQRQ